MKRPCINCCKYLEEHFIKGVPDPFSSSIRNVENWCYPAHAYEVSSKEYKMFYEPMSNLEYLEWKYERATKI